MPIIRISQNAIDRAKPPQAGWHKFKIEKFSEDDSADKKSKNWVFDCPIIESAVDPANVGRYGFVRANSKAPGMLVSSGFLPAVYEHPIDEAFEFNPEEMYGKEFWGEITDGVFNGKTQKNLTAFAPPGEKPV